MEKTTLSPDNVSTSLIEHLGLVADQINQLGLIELIDERLPIEGNGSKISMGERTAGLILNGSGFVDSRLYIFPKFLAKKPISRLFGKEMDAAWFNDDSLGRCLDAIADYGTTKLFTELSFAIAKAKNLFGKSVHFDTTSLQLEGVYANAEQITDPQAVIPAYGYSKSHRDDLKQMVLNLATTGKSNFPIWMEPHSGNASDATILPDAMARMNDLCEQLKISESFLYVADSAAYANVIEHSNKFKWLSRVPGSLKLAKQLLNTPPEKLEWLDKEKGYKGYETTISYGNVKQRWLLVASEQAYQKAAKTLDKQIQKVCSKLSKSWWHLSNQLFACKDDALKAAQKLDANMLYHKVSYEVNEVKKYLQKGRPSQSSQTTTVGYQLTYTISEDTTKISAIKRRKGRFILATNQLKESELSSSSMLAEYKAQSGVERGFKFIKDSSFQVDSVFLKTPSRISALMAIMTLCLMIYGLVQEQIRAALKERNETLPDQKDKQTQNPSLKWIYFMFIGIRQVTIKVGEQETQMVSNLTDTMKQIIGYCGKRAQEIYLQKKSF